MLNNLAEKSEIWIIFFAYDQASSVCSIYPQITYCQAHVKVQVGWRSGAGQVKKLFPVF